MKNHEDIAIWDLQTKNSWFLVWKKTTQNLKNNLYNYLGLSNQRVQVNLCVSG